MRSDFDRLQDVLEAMDAIQRHVAAGRAVFDLDELIRVWCLRHIEIIGEASSRVTEKMRSAHPEIPWREIVGMRNTLVHGYFDVDWDEVWNAVERDLPPLRRAVEAILSQTGERPV